MATISFIIPASSGIVGSDTTILADKGASIKASPNVRKATFGDGYEQRLPDGINSINKEINLTFSPRESSEIDDIIDYFEYLRATTAITLTLPNSNRTETLKVVVEEWSKNYAYDEFYVATAKLRKVNEA